MTDLIFHPPCSALDLADMWPDEPFNAARVGQQLAREGFVVRYRQTGLELPYAYTVGLTELGLPELILYGQSPGHVRHAWAQVGLVLHTLTRPGQKLFQGQFDGRTVQVRKESLRRLPDAYRVYGPEGFTALQVYWTVGSDNHFPQQWEIRFLASQPFLGHGTLRDLASEP